MDNPLLEHITAEDEGAGAQGGGTAVATEPNHLQDLYTSLKGRNPDMPDFDHFKADMQDENNLKALHDSLQKRNPNLPDYDTFKADMMGGTQQPSGEKPDQSAIDKMAAPPKEPIDPKQLYNQQRPDEQSLPEQRIKKAGEDFAKELVLKNQTAIHTPQQDINNEVYEGVNKHLKEVKPAKDYANKEEGEKSFNEAQGKLDDYFQQLKGKGYSDPQIEKAIDAHKDEWRGILGGIVPRSPRQQQANAQYINSNVDNGLNPVASAAGTFDKEIVHFVASIPKAVGIVGSAGASALGKENDATSNDFYKLGTALTNWGDEYFSENPKFKESFLAHDVPQTAGQLLPFMAGGEALKGVSESAKAIDIAKLGTEETPTIGKLFLDHAKENLPTAAVASVTNATGQYDQAYAKVKDANSLTPEQFVQKYGDGDPQSKVSQDALSNYRDLIGRNPNDVAWGTFKTGLVSGAPFMFSPAMTLNRLNKATGGLIQDALNQGVRGGIDGLTQFGTMKAIENLGAQATYEKTREILDGVVDAGSSGLVTNGMMTGLMAALTHKSASLPDGSKEKFIVDKAISEVEAKKAETEGKDYYEKDNSPVVTNLKKQISDLQNDLVNTKNAKAKDAIIESIASLNKQLVSERQKATAKNSAEGLKNVDVEFNKKEADELNEELKNPKLTEKGKAIIQEQINKLNPKKDATTETKPDKSVNAQAQPDNEGGNKPVADAGAEKETTEITPDQEEHRKETESVKPFVEVEGKKYYGADHTEAIEKAQEEHPDFKPTEEWKAQNGMFEITPKEGKPYDVTRDEGQEHLGISESKDIPDELKPKSDEPTTTKPSVQETPETADKPKQGDNAPDDGKLSGEEDHTKITTAEQAHKFAKDNGFTSANHLLNAFNKKEGTDYGMVQDVPKEKMSEFLSKKSEAPVKAEEKPTVGKEIEPHKEEGGEQFGEKGESKTVGIAERLHPEHEAGEGLSAEEHVNRGKELIKKDEYSQENIRKRFEKDNDLSSEDLDAARAHYEKMIMEADKLADDGNKAEADKLEEKAAEWKKNVIDPVGTETSEKFRGFQGETDINTGSFTSLVRAYKERTGKDLTETQAKEAKELSSEVKTLTDKYGELQKKYTDAMDKWAAETEAAVKEALAKERVKNLRPERKAQLKQAISEDFAALANVKFFAQEASKNPNDIIRTVGRLIKNTAELGGLEIEDAIKNVISKLPHLANFINDNKDAITKNIESEAPKGKEKIDPLTHFVDKKDSKFTPEEVIAIWKHATSEYLDKGSSIPEMIRGVSMDLGLTSKQVQEAIAMPKGVRTISDQMYLNQRARRQAVSNAKYFVETAGIPKWKKFVPFSKTSIWSSLFFQKSVFAHTGVGMQTHSGMNIYDPTQWHNYFKSYVQQFKNLSKVEYEKSMENMKNDPEYASWLKAGLDIDPHKGYTEYEAKPVLGFLGKFFNKVGEAGNRGFGALKTFRFQLAKDYYNNLSEVEKADPNTKKNLAQLFNNSTGVGDVKPNKLIKTLVFAPKLIASRWNRLIIQPAKAIGILAKGKDATPAERAQLKVTAKRAGIELATMGGLLALNQALLVASGSNTRVNFTDPSKPDWMRFRFGNTALDLSGGMVGTAQFVARVLTDIAPWTTQKDLKGKTRREAIEIAAGNYAFNTISPVSSTIAEPILRHDFNGNTVPWSDEKPLYKTAHKLTWKEYLWQQAPIPAAEAAKDMYTSMHDSGMSDMQIGDIFTGVMKGIISGGTGARVMELKDNSGNATPSSSNESPYSTGKGTKLTGTKVVITPQEREEAKKAGEEAKKNMPKANKSELSKYLR